MSLMRDRQPTANHISLRLLFFRARRSNCIEVDRLRVAFLYRNPLAFLLKRLQELRILPFPSFNLFPAEELVVTRTDARQIEVSILISRHGFVAPKLVASGFI